MKGLYPQNAASIADGIENLEEGMAIEVEPELGAYKEEYLVVSQEDIYLIKDNLAIINVRQTFKNKNNLSRSYDKPRAWSNVA